ncbi:MAG: response regulator [Melioribacter sp.]|uniref:response regulator n=1 Tax=Rosettibacter primus TaxID=3111523 RepID=UPI00247E0EEE|nr:response regulator [Melioribacter sp.]
MQKRKILIVEDEAIVALEIKYRLTSLNYEVVGTASTGEKALALAEETRPDLVLMDLKLKGKMNGLETAHELKNKFSIPSIFITAYSDDTTLNEIQENGFIILQKPFTPEELQNVIENVLK